MIRWFFYAIIAIVVNVLSERIYSKNVSEHSEMSLASSVILLIVGIVCVLSFWSSIVFFFIGLFKILSNFNCW